MAPHPLSLAPLLSSINNRAICIIIIFIIIIIILYYTYYAHISALGVSQLHHCDFYIEDSFSPAIRITRGITDGHFKLLYF